MRGKDKCKILKEIRQRIADENDIPYVTRECSYHGECTGTCPRCESELRYLEQQLERRRSLGKRVSVAAICVGMALASAGCAPTVKQPTESMQTDLTGEVGPDESNIGELGGMNVEPGSDIEELSGEVDICEPTSGTDSVDLTGNELSGAVKEPEPDYIELSGDVAYPDGYDYAGSEDVMVTTTGEVAWPEA
jgi:hypothetical protein